MKKIRTVLSLILTITVFSTGIICARASERKSIISAYTDEFCKKTKCSSVSVAVVLGDETEFYGNTDGLYQIGSMTKAFTGLGIQKLISDEVIGEDDHISEWLPGFTAIYAGETCDITIWQLLTQTSGYTNNETDYPSATEEMSLMEWTHSISGRELTNRPGTEYAYSNVNYNLLGAVIEQASGRSYKEYMETEILLPLGLTETFVSVSDEYDSVIHGSRLGYFGSFEYDIPVATGRIPAGYFYSDANDMARWMQIWMGAADIPQEYKDLVSSVKSMLVNEGDYYSGWELFENETIGHSGGTPNYSSRIVFDDKKQIGVCVLTNLNVAASTDGLCNGIYSIAADEEPKAIPTDVWTVFDIIFTAVTVIGMLFIAMSVRVKRRGALIGSGCFLILLLISVCIVMPLVFGAGLGNIIFTWAPYSFAGGLLMLMAGILATAIRLWIMKKNEN